MPSVTNTVIGDALAECGPSGTQREHEDSVVGDHQSELHTSDGTNVKSEAAVQGKGCRPGNTRVRFLANDLVPQLLDKRIFANGEKEKEHVRAERRDKGEGLYIDKLEKTCGWKPRGSQYRRLSKGLRLE